MSVMTQAIHKAAMSSKQAGGSLATQKNRRLDATGLLRFARQVGELHPSIQEIPDWVIHLYAQYCTAQGKAPGTLANIFSTIRVLNTATEKSPVQTSSNKALGIARRERKGKKRALTGTEIASLLERARHIDDGLTHTVSIALVLGLRRKEALMCAHDLPMWLDAITKGESHVPVMRGAKNGRPRTVRILEGRREQTAQIIRAALTFARHHEFRLINGQTATLEGAMNRMKALIRRLGMSGEVSFHALRYTYAFESANEMLAAGLSPYETLVELSESLGHGPTRTQMILNHYCQSIKDRFDGYLSLSEQEHHSRRLPGILPRAAARLEAKLHHATLSGYPVGKTPLSPEQHLESKDSRIFSDPVTETEASSAK
jgi:integrase